MEEALLLRDLGVDQELEGTVLSRFFASKGLPEEAAHPHPQTQNLTQAVLEGTVVDEEAQGDDHRPSTCKTILLPEEWKKSRAETSTSGVLYGKLTNPFDHDIPSNEEVEFLEAVCPHCNSTFLFPRDEVDERLATHISRCESQRLRRKARNKCNYSAFDNEETESLADSSEEDRPSKRRPRKSTGLKPARRQVDIEVQRSSSPIEVESDSSVVDVDGYSNKIDPMACQDDWEERDYERRLSLLSAADLRTIETPFGGILYAHTWERLHEYQRQGCEWLHNLYREGAGGILADEMGLGKTAQACAHFGSLGGLSSRLYRSGNAATLIACPATVLQHWLNEMHRWAPGVRVGVLHSISKTGKELSSLKAKGLASVLKSFRRGDKKLHGVAIITTYDNLRKHREALSAIEWSAICLDEGQKIRNPATVISQICKELPAFHRIILSGTPIQNSLKELWNLFDFIYPGRLGSLPVFEIELATPIRIGGYASASRLQRRIAIECAATLQRIIRPYLLRRRKQDIMSLLGDQMPNKVEQILFCAISPLQKSVYKEILASSEVHDVLNRRRPAFRAINTLRKLCNHPSLVYSCGRILWQQDKEFIKTLPFTHDPTVPSLPDDEEDIPYGASSLCWEDSGKLVVLSKILPLWKEEGHKVLIFCQTSSMLGIIEAMIRQMKLQYLRMDGQTPVGKRATLIHSFNHSPEIFAMILTTRTGGLGISLTAANRVILFDPDWNPMTDIQARERAYRLGQQRDVVIYRLLTRGTIEEKIYQRQIFKILLSSRILENPKEKSMFGFSDLRDLFSLQELDGGMEAECLPAEGRVDIEAGTETKGTTEEPEDNDTAQDKRILRALFNGEALSSVYDHSFLETGHSDQQKTQQQQHAEQVAKKAVAALQSSVKAHVPGPAETLTSASLLQELRAKREARTDDAPVARSIDDSIRDRLKKLFQSGRAADGLSSAAILSHFHDLGDHLAPLFRSILREVAVRGPNGSWMLKT